MAKAQKDVININELDMEFAEEIAKAGGDKIYICFQCGTCTASCPISKFDENYNPRQILRAAFLGLTDRVLPSDLIWMCAICYSCTQRCPRGVRPTEVIQAIRNLAVKKGYIHPFYKAQGEAIVDFGRIYEDVEFINEMRSDMELPPIPPVDLEEVTKLLEYTKAKQNLETEKEAVKP